MDFEAIWALQNQPETDTTRPKIHHKNVVKHNRVFLRASHRLGAMMGRSRLRLEVESVQKRGGNVLICSNQLDHKKVVQISDESILGRDG